MSLASDSVMYLDKIILYGIQKCVYRDHIWLRWIVYFIFVMVLIVSANLCCESWSIRPLLKDWIMGRYCGHVVLFNIPGEVSLIGVIIHGRCTRYL